MSPQAARRAALAMLSVWAIALAAGLVLTALLWGAKTPSGTGGFGDFGGFFAGAAYPIVGALIVSRRPDNRIGWLFLTVGLLLVAAWLAPLYVNEGRFVRPGSLPGTQWAAWASGWLEPTFIVSVALVLLLFPDGRLPSRRWRPALWLVLTGLALASILDSALKPGVIRDDLPVRNPIGIERAAGIFAELDNWVWLLFVASILAGAAGMVVRFAHARGVVRQQVKWIAFAALFLVLALLLDIAAAAVGRGHRLVDAVFGIAFAGIPVAAGVAILRYRLYEIDRIINRTLVYAGLTAALAGLYFGIVVGLQAALSSFTQGNELAVAGSTLAVAALFRPARRRIQALVDRRFYRSKVDAARTLDAFSARLRREIDLEALSVELRSAVEETMRPAHASLWLRVPEVER